MNENKISPDDPKLTAYALGELEGEQRMAVEAALQGDAVAQAAVEEIRATAAWMKAALAAEPLVANTAPMAAPQVAYPYVMEPKRGKLLRFPQVYYFIGGLAAACFAVLVVLHEPEPRSFGPVKAK